MLVSRDSSPPRRRWRVGEPSNEAREPHMSEHARRERWIVLRRNGPAHRVVYGEDELTVWTRCGRLGGHYWPDELPSRRPARACRRCPAVRRRR